MTIHFRFATLDDSSIIAQMNLQLIRDEGHRNAMDVAQLRERMKNWLSGEYKAVLFEMNHQILGYALFRDEDEYAYLRHFFVVPECRRRGIARRALAWLWGNAWPQAHCLRIEVLIGNSIGRAFWHSVGFSEYCVTMEASPPQ